PRGSAAGGNYPFTFLAKIGYFPQACPRFITRQRSPQKDPNITGTRRLVRGSYYEPRTSSYSTNS
ncbi:hypothetical protein T484DRAFT_1979480, partial [Baffinella frigidus]